MSEETKQEDFDLSEEEIFQHREEREESLRKNRKKVFLRELLDFGKTFVFSAILVFVIVHFIATPVQVKGNSMYPTLQDEEIGLSNVIGRKMSGLERFDIVVIFLDRREDYLVKRLIGLPGETISYVDNQLYINGEPMDEPFLDQDYVNTFSAPFTEDIEEITLGDNEIFCLGDNRPTSRDSRYYGPFQLEQVTSKGVFVIYPFSEFGVKSW